MVSHLIFRLSWLAFQWRCVLPFQITQREHQLLLVVLVLILLWVILILCNRGGGNVATWYPLTFGGAASGTHAARVSATEPSWLWSDLIPCSALPRVDSESGAIIHTRLIQGTAGGDATSWSAMWAPHALVADIIKHQWRGCASAAAVDYATTNQAAFTTGSNSGTANTTHLPCMIQYVSLTQGQTLLTIGDSITAGLNTGTGGAAANGYGWTAKLRDLLSTPEVPVELCNLGYSGATMAMITGIYTRNASELKNCLLLHTMYTPNSIDVVLAKKELVKSLAIMDSMGHVPIYWTGLPRNATVAGGGLGGTSAANLGAYEAQRVEYNIEILSANENVLDLSSAVSGSVVASGTAAGQMEYAIGNSDDGLHPNNTAHDDIANYAYPYLLNRI